MDSSIDHVIESALRRSTSCFSDPSLKDGKLVNLASVQEVKNGTFSHVVRLKSGRVDWAVHIFKNSSNDRATELTKIQESFGQFGFPDYIPTFTFVKDGFRTSELSLDLVKLPVNRGIRLAEWLKANREDQVLLLKAAARWWWLTEDLRHHGMTYIGMNPTRLIINSDGGMSISHPELLRLGEGPFRPDDLQHQDTDWRHPQWNSLSRGVSCMEFATFVGYCSLMAIIHDSNIDGISGDGNYKMVSATDLKTPRSSALIQRMASSSNSILSRLGFLLSDWSERSPGDYSLWSIRTSERATLPGLRCFSFPSEKKVQVEPAVATHETDQMKQAPPGREDSDNIGKTARKKSSKKTTVFLVGATVIVYFLYVNYLSVDSIQLTPADVGDGSSLRLKLETLQTAEPPSTRVLTQPPVVGNQGTRPVDEEASTDSVSKDKPVYYRFAMAPQTATSWGKYYLFPAGDPTNVVVERDSSDTELNLPAGDYGYGFVDRQGNRFGIRLRGITLIPES